MSVIKHLKETTQRLFNSPMFIFLTAKDLKSLYFDRISSKISLEGYQPGIDTDLLPVEPSVASGVFINFHR